MSAPLREQNELDWLTSVLGGYVEGPSTSYLCRPSRAVPQLLVPLQPTKVTRTSMRRDHDDRDVKERVQGVVAQTIARLGVLRFAGGEVLKLPPFGLVRQIERELGEAQLRATVSLGPRRRNRKPVLQLIRPDGTPVAFVKVGWSALTRELVTNEAHWLELVEGQLPDAVAAPEVLLRHAGVDSVTAQETIAIATTPLPVRARGRRTEPVSTQIIRAISALSRKDGIPFSELPTLQMWTGDPELAELLLLDQLLQRHGEVVINTGLWHGDLTPWNTASSGGLMYLWDWEFAGDHRPIGFDAMHEAFERTRRATKNNEKHALDLIVAEANQILRPFLDANPSKGKIDAIVDLYLCELIAREHRLAGEGWKPGNLGPLDKVAQRVLSQRLAT